MNPRIPFHPALIDLADDAIREACNGQPLHDAAEVAWAGGAGVPTVMLFVQSLRGICHNKIEDTKEEHLAMAVRALDALAERAMGWIVKKAEG